MCDGTIHCCFCDEKVEFVNSNNPWPIGDDFDSGRCCGKCNRTIVMRARRILVNSSERDRDAVVEKFNNMSYEEAKEMLQNDKKEFRIVERKRKK